MSDILIKNMEMPTCCDDCFALDDSGDYPCCLISHDQRGYTFRTDIRTMPSCPLIEVPTPHGRLIDADALEEKCHRLSQDEWNKSTGASWGYAYATFESDVEDAPTIIEAEDGE